MNFDNAVITELEQDRQKITFLRYKPKLEWYDSAERDMKKFSGTIEFYTASGKLLGKLSMLDGEGFEEPDNQKGLSTTCTYKFKNSLCTGETTQEGDISGGSYSCTYNFTGTCTTTYTYDSPTYSEETIDQGDSGGGGGITTTPLPDKEVVFEIKVDLKDKELCAYNRLQWAGVNPTNGYINMMTQLFIEFGEGNIGGADLIITERDLGYRGGDSNLRTDGKFEIVLSRMGDRSSIEIAAVLVQEMAHTFLAKHYAMYNSSFKELYAKYMNVQGLPNYSHNIMRDRFIERMAQVLYDYDNTLFININDYKILASAGVYDYDENQLAEYHRVINYAKANDKRCQEIN